MYKKINGQNIVVEYKYIKNMNMYIKPPDGHILITVPKGTKWKKIEDFVTTKKSWIENAQKKVIAQNINDGNFVSPSAENIRKLQQEVREFADKWEEIMGVHAVKYTIRDMKTRWGSCTPAKKTIRISSRLINYSKECLEYIVVHELCHLIEPSHNQRFKKYMTLFLPDWKERKEKLKMPPVFNK